MAHIVILTACMVLWIRICSSAGKLKARSGYPLNAPELTVVQNGIRWLKTHNLDKLRLENLLYSYLLIVFFKLVYMHFFPGEYVLWQRIILIGIIAVLPIAIFPYFHDRAYYKEYNRLMKCTYDEPWYYEQHIPGSLSQVGKRERLTLLFTGIILYAIQLVIIILS